MRTWRDTARPIIAKVLKETRGMDEKVIRMALRAAYPFGMRRYHPYKVWCDEVRRQRGLKTKGPKKGALRDVPPDPRQQGLFDDEDG